MPKILKETNGQVNRVKDVVIEPSKGPTQHVTKGSVLHVKILRPDLRRLDFRVRGTTPYVQEKFGPKAKQMMRDAMTAGDTGVKRKKQV